MKQRNLVIPVGNVNLVNPIPDDYLDPVREKISADLEKSRQAEKVRKELDRLIAQTAEQHKLEAKVEESKKTEKPEFTIDKDGVKRGPNGRRLNKDGTERKARTDVGKKRGPRKTKS